MFNDAFYNGWNEAFCQQFAIAKYILGYWQCWEFFFCIWVHVGGACQTFFQQHWQPFFLTWLKVTLIFFERMKKLIKKQHLSIKILLVWHGNVIKIDEIFQMDLHQHFFKANHNYQFFTCQSPIWNESKISRIFHLKFFLHPPHTLLLSKCKYKWRWLCELWAHK